MIASWNPMLNKDDPTIIWGVLKEECLPLTYISSKIRLMAALSKSACEQDFSTSSGESEKSGGRLGKKGREMFVPDSQNETAQIEGMDIGDIAVIQQVAVIAVDEIPFCIP